MSVCVSWGKLSTTGLPRVGKEVAYRPGRVSSGQETRDTPKGAFSDKVEDAKKQFKVRSHNLTTQQPEARTKGAIRYSSGMSCHVLRCPAIGVTMRVCTGLYVWYRWATYSRWCCRRPSCTRASPSPPRSSGK
jgi:hypothetical protein